MEAATPLRQSHVAVVGDRLVVRELDVQDECAVRLVREREQAGDDPVKTVRDAIEIGARVLDREQAAANAEYVKTEFERVSREVESQFTDKARTVAEHFGTKVDEVFGPETGRLARDLEKLFGDGSSASVQNRVRELVNEALVRSRQDLVRQFSAADGSNPLADFKAGALESINQAANRQHATQRALLQQLGDLQKELQALRDEKDKLEEVSAERERGTAKGRSFEESVAEAVDAMALRQGDVAEAVGDQPGASGKTGDVVVDIGACNGPARGRVVFEAKDRRLSKPGALEELDRALSDRDADFAVLVVPTADELPGQAGAAARVQRRQAAGGARPRGPRGAHPRGRLPAGARTRAHVAGRERGRRRRRGARRGGARRERDGGRAPREEPAHRGQDRTSTGPTSSSTSSRRGCADTSPRSTRWCWPGRRTRTRAAGRRAEPASRAAGRSELQQRRRSRSCARRPRSAWPA